MNKRLGLGLLSVVCALVAALAIGWFSDERNQIAAFGERSLRTHERLLGVERGMALEEAVNILDAKGIARNRMSEWDGPYAPRQCGGQSVAGYEHVTLTDPKRNFGSVCLLAEDGRVIAMHARYSAFTLP